MGSVRQSRPNTDTADLKIRRMPRVQMSHFVSDSPDRLRLPVVRRYRLPEPDTWPDSGPIYEMPNKRETHAQVPRRKEFSQ